MAIISGRSPICFSLFFFFSFLYLFLPNNVFHWLYAEVVQKFNDELESSNNICQEKAEGILSLYEASFSNGRWMLFGWNETFCHQHLSKYLKSSGDEIICIMVRHALELLLHWRMPRLEVRWFINLYRRKPELNPSICIA